MAPSRENVQNVYPLLPMQQGMLFTRLMDQESRAYFQQVIFRIHGEFDPGTCAQAWNELMRRHEVLRSVFVHEKTAQPVQITLKQREVAFHVEDLRFRDREQQQVRVREYLTEDRRRDFHLAADTLMRVRVFVLSGDDSELVWSHPHILVDGWSGSLLMKEFAIIYAAIRAGVEPDLPVLTPYGEYIDWFNRHDHAAAQRFWAEELSGFEATTGLPKTWAVRRAAGYDPRTYSFHLDASETASLLRLARRNSLTPNTFLQTMWAVLLSRYNDTVDVLFGTIVSGRDADIAGIEDMAGMFINAAPVRIRLSPAETFVQALRRRQHSAFRQGQYATVSLADVHAAEFVDHLLVFENFPSGGVAEASLGFAVTSSETLEQAHYDFGVLASLNEVLSITFSYNGNLYDREVLSRIEGHWRKLLAHVLENPDRPLESLQILTEAEEAALERFSHGDIRPWPPDQTLTGFWDNQVRRTPDNVALISERSQLSYVQLNARAVELAGLLQQKFGYRPEQRIAVILPRGEWEIVAMLAIWKAGFTYVPLDASTPGERLRFVLQDSGCAAALVDESTWQLVEELQPGLALMVVRDHHAKFAAEAVTYHSRSAAYIIYTSGSTGNPKGVVVEHSGFVNMILDQIRAFGIGPEDRILQFAPYCFDAALSEYFHAFSTGAALVLVSSDMIRNPADLAEHLDRHRVSVATFPPSYLRGLDRPLFPSLRVLISAGEAASSEDAARYAGAVRYFNGYGPTETSVCATYFEVHPGRDFSRGVPIGRPVANTRVRILDCSLRPAPIGVPGEICVSGPGLAREYANAPALTREKFIADPDRPGERMYRTGDRGCWSNDGEIEYLGRTDGQVKVNGHRIELAEIEALLERCPQVRQAAVVLGPNQIGTHQICAYYAESKPSDPSALRDYLAARLPGYMVPAQVLRLGSLPVNANGKVDRNALSRLVTDSPVEEPVERSAMTDSERVLAEVCEEVLGRKTVSLHATFRDLGGDSLKSIQVAGRLRKRGWTLPVKALFEEQTFRSVARSMAPVVSAPRGTARRLALSPIQRNFFREHDSGTSQLLHTVLLSARERVDQKALSLAVQALWRNHDSLRFQFIAGETGITQTESPADQNAPLEMVLLDDFQEPGQAIRAHVAGVLAGFDLQDSPLFRATLIRARNSDFVLLIAHHLVVDAISWQILLEDLDEAYHQAVQGRAVELATPTLSFAEWVHRLDEYARGPVLDNEMAYWSSVDAQAQPIATDFPYVPHTYGQTSSLEVTLRIGEEPEQLSSAKDLQLLLLTAFSRALYRAADTGPARIMLSGHGRHLYDSDLDVSRTAGWFTAEYPLLLGPAGAGDFDSQLSGVRSALAKVPSGGIGYGLCRYMRQERSFTAARDDISFNYIGAAQRFVGRHFSSSDLLPSASIGPSLRRRRTYEVEVSGPASELSINFRYCSLIHKHETARHITGLYLDEIETSLRLLLHRIPISHTSWQEA